MVVKPPTRQPRNVKFRLWLSVELIYMPLITSSSCARRPETEETTLFTKAWTLAFQLMHFQNVKKEPISLCISQP